MLGRAFAKLYPKKVVDRAEQELARLASIVGQNAPNQEDSRLIKAKANIRGGKTVLSHQQDPGGHRIERALVICQPLQQYVNHGFHAEKCMGKFVSSVCSTPAPPHSAPPDAEAIREAAIHANLGFVLGTHGNFVVQSFSRLLTDLSGGAWTDLQIEAADKHSTCQAVVVALCDCWKRLVFEQDVPKNEILQVCRYKCYDAELVRRVVEPLLARKQQCDRCVDDHFTEIWCQRLRHSQQSVCDAALTALRDLVAALPVLSTRTERKHCLGQETARVKRGRPPSCRSLAKRTYCKSVKSEACARRQLVIASHLKTGAMKRSFSQLLTSSEFGRKKRRGQKDDNRALAKRG